MGGRSISRMTFGGIGSSADPARINPPVRIRRVRLWLGGPRGCNHWGSSVVPSARGHCGPSGRVPNAAATWLARQRCRAAFARPGEVWRRYLSGTGGYPWTVRVRTPAGPMDVATRCPQDLAELVDVVCRRVYDVPGRRAAGAGVLDVGARGGYAAFWLLATGRAAHVRVVEPDGDEAAHAARLLEPFGDRGAVTTAAVTTSGAGEDRGGTPAVGLVDVLQEVLGRTGRIGLVKLTPSGSAMGLLAALREAGLGSSIGAVVYRDDAGLIQWLLS